MRPEPTHGVIVLSDLKSCCAKIRGEGKVNMVPFASNVAFKQTTPPPHTATICLFGLLREHDHIRRQYSIT